MYTLHLKYFSPLYLPCSSWLREFLFVTRIALTRGCITLWWSSSHLENCYREK